MAGAEAGRGLTTVPPHQHHTQVKQLFNKKNQSGGGGGRGPDDEGDSSSSSGSSTPAPAPSRPAAAVGAQPRALANAVYAYAANIDNLDALKGAIALIAHKHASLHVSSQAHLCDSYTTTNNTHGSTASSLHPPQHAHQLNHG